MISTKDCTILTGNLQFLEGESNAFYEQLLPFACNNSKAESPNMPNKLWLNSTMEENCPPCFHMSYAKMKSMPVHGFAKFVTREDDCSRTPGSVSGYSPIEEEVKDMDHNDAIVAACHLLLLSNSLQSQERGWDSPTEWLQEKYAKSLRYPFEEDSDSFTPGSLTSGISPSNYDCPSSGSGASHTNIRTETSSMVTDSEVTSDSNAPVKKRKKSNGRLLADIVGQERGSEVLDRPARKRRYRSLADLLRQLH